jgi:hypothetical protein
MQVLNNNNSKEGINNGVKKAEILLRLKLYLIG